MKPDPAVKPAARVSSQTIHFINRTGSLIKSAWEEEESLTMKSNIKEDRECTRASTLPSDIQEEYIDEETEALSNKGRKYLNELY